MPGALKAPTFPVNEKNDEGGVMDASRQQLLQLKALLTQYRKISVSGFPGIHDELLSTRNFYGIRAAIVYDVNNNSMSYTLTIPLKLLQTGSVSNKEWPFTIKVNHAWKKDVTAQEIWWAQLNGINGINPDEHGNYNYQELRKIASSDRSKSVQDERSETNLNSLKAGKAKFHTKGLDGDSLFSTDVIPLTRRAEISGKYILQ